MQISGLVAFKMIKFCVIFLTLIVYGYAIVSDKLKLSLPDGSQLIGRYMESTTGKGIRAFMGLRYAEPPIGDLRFRAPKPARPAKGVYIAQSDGNVCTQRYPFFRHPEVYGEEDCLFLNVFSPLESTKPLPVMVWFHGGGFMGGGGVTAYYKPDYFLDHEVVFVTVNYRLGPLGFLSTEQEDCYGNWGLKDQQESLRWVQKNIAAFSGDPENVLIFGESAGGASVTYHMQSKLSQGLFHKVIAQSGVNICPWGTAPPKGLAESRAKMMGEKFNCQLEGNNYQDMVNCLRYVNAHNFTRAFYDFYKWDIDPMVPFPPVIEAEHDGAFITERQRSNPPHGNSIPFMTGVTSEEGLLKTAPLFNDVSLEDSFNTHFQSALPISLFYDHMEPAHQQVITKRIAQFYLNNTMKLTKYNQKDMTNIYTDNWFTGPMIEYLKMRFNSPDHAETFVYLYTQKGCCSFSEPFLGHPEEFYGTSHADELLALFPITFQLENFYSSLPTPDDRKLKDIMTKLFVNFAYTGNPTPDTATDLTKWTVADNFPLEVMRLGNENGYKPDLMAMRKGLYDTRIQFWEELEKELKYRFSNKYFYKKKCKL